MALHRIFLWHYFSSLPLQTIYDLFFFLFHPSGKWNEYTRTLDRPFLPFFFIVNSVIFFNFFWAATEFKVRSWCLKGPLCAHVLCIQYDCSFYSHSLCSWNMSQHVFKRHQSMVVLLFSAAAAAAADALLLMCRFMFTFEGKSDRQSAAYTSQNRQES